MFDRLRNPFFIAAVIVLLIAIGIEAGTSFLPAQFDEGLMRMQTKDALANSDLSSDDRADLTKQMIENGRTSQKPPGMAISYMALLDGLLLFALLVMASPWFRELISRIQGVVTLVLSILVILAGILLALKAFLLLMIMVSLFLSAPFGTLAYLAIWGFFPLGTASGMLAASLLLKLVFIVLLVLAEQEFLKNKGLMGIILTSLLSCFLIGFLLAYVPGFLASITDAIAAIVVIIFVIIWAIFLLLGSISAIKKAI